MGLWETPRSNLSYNRTLYKTVSQKRLRNMVNHNSSYVIVEKNIKLNRNFCFFLTGNNPDTIEDYISLR